MAVIIFILGLVIGSFLNVVIYRLPKGESIVRPPSHCPECGHRLKPLELVPIVSYIFLRGKCSNCGIRISVRYPMVELFTAIIFTGNYIMFSDIMNIVAGLVLSSILIALTMIDYDHQILPDSLTLGGLAIGLIFSFIRPGFNALTGISGIFAAGGLLFVVALVSKGGLGGGDIKLMAMTGSFLGPLSAVAAVFLGALIGLIASLPGIITGKLEMKSKLPFGPFLAIASMIFWFWGDIFWNWYLGLIL